MADWKIEFVEKAKPEEVRWVIGKLSDYNDTHSPTPFQRHDIRLFVRDEGGQILAGLIAGVTMHCLLLQILWVDDSLRRQGCGRALVERAMELAAARGAKMALVETTLFQAPSFYEKLGFKPICEIADSPIGSKTILFQKML